MAGSLSQDANKITRWAAGSFFGACVPLAIWDQSYVPNKIFIPGDAATTASNLLSNEFIFRTSIFTHLLGIGIFVTVVLMFSHVFKPVDKNLSRVMALAIVPLLPVTFILELINFSALIIIKSADGAHAHTQQQELAYTFMRMYRFGVGPGLGKLFIGLSFVPFGMLVVRSGFVPRIIGILLIVGGVGYLIDCSVSILLQRNDYIMVRSFLKYTTIAYVAALLWFLIKGVKIIEGTQP